MIKYQIAIPSYKRADQLKDKTLALLERHNVDPELITVFVASCQESLAYRLMLDSREWSKRIKTVIGNRGMRAIRNFIQSYYKEGDYVINLDDDIQDVMRKVDDKKMEPITNFYSELVEPGYKAMLDNDAYLWGVYAASNAMFMKHRTAVGLYFCVGSCWGVQIRHSNDLYVSLDEKEDYERTLQHYVKDGKVTRLDNITVKTKYYDIGGMEEDRTDPNISSKAADELIRRFPGLCTSYVRETTGRTELRLKDTRGVRPEELNTLEGFFQ